MRLRLKLTLFMIILVNLSLILLSVINTTKSYEIVENSVENSAFEMVKTQSSMVTEITVKQMQMPHYLSVDENVIGFLTDQQSQEKFNKVTEMFDKYIFDKNNLEGIFLANSEGLVVVSYSANPERIGIDLSDRNYYTRTIQEKKSIISETLYSKVSGDPMFTITVPVFSNDGQDVIGFIGTVVLAESLSIYLEDMKLSNMESSEAFLVDGKGNYIYTPKEDLIGHPVKIKEIEDLVLQFKNKNTDTVDIINYKSNGQNMMAAYSTVSGTDWLLVTTGSLDELQAPIRSMNIFMLIIVAILSSALTFVIFFATKIFTQPVIDDLINNNLKLGKINQDFKESEERLKDTSEILKRKNKLLEITLEASNDGIWYYEVLGSEKNIVDNFGTYIWFGKSIKNLKDWNSLIHPDDRMKSKKQFKEFINGKIDEFDMIQRVLHSDDTYHWIRSKGKAFFDEAGNRYILAGVHTDINELKNKEEQLNYLAYFDSLTDIPNRVLLLDRLEKSITYSQNNDSNLAVLFIDIDNFKRINDSMGHQFGDQILKQTALRLSEKLRESDIVSRFGGDEFVVILSNLNSKVDAYDIANIFMDAFLDPFYVQQSKVFMNISIGIAVYPHDGTSSEELLSNADIAMYKAKKEGKNRVDFYEPNLKNDVVTKLDFEKGLRQAINNREFILYYQPQYTVNDNTIRGFEALIRWENPQKGIIGPREFIDVAEDTGMIIPIGEWVIREACETLVKWRNKYGFDGVISVNISPLQIKHIDFVDIIQRVLEQTGLDPQKLELEITESILIESFDLTVEKLIELRKLGIHISLDDFGTGYSSLSYLKSLPVDTLKIDKSFIDEIIQDSNSKEIIGSIINLVQKLKMETIAEGVETREQYEYLKSVGCDCYQGYYMSKPIPENEVNENIFEKRT